MLMKSIAFVLITVAWRSRENEAIEKASIIVPIKSTCMKGKPLESQLLVHPINDATQFFRHESYLTRVHPLHRTLHGEHLFFSFDHIRLMISINQSNREASILVAIKSTCMKGKLLESQLLSSPCHQRCDTSSFDMRAIWHKFFPCTALHKKKTQKKSSWNFLDTLFTEMFSTNFQPSVLTNLQHPASIKVSFAKLMIEKSIHEDCVVRLLKLQVINGRVGWADWILDILFFVICSLYSLL